MTDERSDATLGFIFYAVGAFFLLVMLVIWFLATAEAHPGFAKFFHLTR